MGLIILDTYPHLKFRKIILDSGLGGRGFHRGCGQLERRAVDNFAKLANLQDLERTDPK